MNSYHCWFQTVSKAFELLSELLKFFGVRTCPQLDVLLARLPTILQRTVNSLNWDIRDTAMNFIGKLMSLCTGEASQIESCSLTFRLLQYVLHDISIYVKNLLISWPMPFVSGSWWSDS